MILSVITPTHDPRWLAPTWRSLRAQGGEWEWIISANDEHGRADQVAALADDVRDLVDNDPRVRIHLDTTPWTGMGARKRIAFGQGAGEVLVELDHDDLLVPGALEKIAAVFSAEPGVGFVYSDWADFDSSGGEQGGHTYRDPGVRRGWLKNGYSFYDARLEGERAGAYECVRGLPPTARALSHIYTAPNHVRAWRRDVYHRIAGHDPRYRLADDHELLCRTYQATKLHHIAEPLYLYRITGDNTWSRHVGDIKAISDKIRSTYLEALVMRECELLGAPVFDLGGAISPRPGWRSVDVAGDVDVTADLRLAWPWADGSVGAFRAADLLEHLPDKQHTMTEIHRCLRPGGWLLASTPSTDGRGAFQDPTHVSFWNENSFWYWTRPEFARYLRAPALFDEVELYTSTPTQWHVDNRVPYVVASLVKR